MLISPICECVDQHRASYLPLQCCQWQSTILVIYLLLFCRPLSLSFCTPACRTCLFFILNFPVQFLCLSQNPSRKDPNIKLKSHRTSSFFSLRLFMSQQPLHLSLFAYAVSVLFRQTAVQLNTCVSTSPIIVQIPRSDVINFNISISRGQLSHLV